MTVTDGELDSELVTLGLCDRESEPVADTLPLFVGVGGGVTVTVEEWLNEEDEVASLPLRDKENVSDEDGVAVFGGVMVIVGDPLLDAENEIVGAVSDIVLDAEKLLVIVGAGVIVADADFEEVNERE